MSRWYTIKPVRKGIQTCFIPCPEHNSQFWVEMFTNRQICNSGGTRMSKEGGGGTSRGKVLYVCVGGGGAADKPIGKKKQKHTPQRTLETTNKNLVAKLMTVDWEWGGATNLQMPPPPPNDFQTLTLAIFIQSLAVSPGIVMSLPAWRKKEK